MAVVFETQDYRSSPEWQALNRIWKAVPASAREGVKEDFRIITEVIKGMGQKEESPKTASAVTASATAQPAPVQPVPVQSAPAAIPGGRENFLRGMSAPAKKLALSILTREGFDIYGYLETLMAQSRAKTADDLWDAYVSERDIDEENEDALREIIEVCVSRRN